MYVLNGHVTDEGFWHQQKQLCGNASRPSHGEGTAPSGWALASFLSWELSFYLFTSRLPHDSIQRHKIQFESYLFS